MAGHFAREQQIFGAATPYYGWLYPPLFLFVATPLALLPYPLALIAWQGATFALYLAVIAAILRQPRHQGGAIARLWLPVAAAFPAVFINLGHGQNGFLTAGLLGAALLALPQRPVLSGVLFGLLAYKPQFGLLIPFALLAGAQWRTMIAAGLTVIALAGTTTLAFGPEIWWVFAASTETARKLLLEQGDVGSPHVLDNDLTIVGPAMAFMAASIDARGGALDYEISLMAVAWIAPLLARGIAGASGLPIGLITIVALYGVVMRCATETRTGPVIVATGIAQA